MKCFSRGFGALELPFGSLEGPLEAVLGGLRTPKTLKNTMFFQGFSQVNVLAPLDLFVGLRGPSWHARGRFGSQNGPQKGPRNCTKIVQKRSLKKVPKWTQKWSPKAIKFSGFLGSVLGSFSGFWPRGLKMTPRCPERAPRWSQTGPKQG